MNNNVDLTDLGVHRFNQRDLLEKCVYLLHPIAPVHALGEASASSGTVAVLGGGEHHACGELGFTRR